MRNASFLEQILARDPRKIVQLPDLPLDDALSEWPALLSAATAPAAPEMPAVPVPAPGPAAPSSGQIAALATHLWRARAKLLNPQTGEPTEENRRTLRHLDSGMDMLSAMGVVIRDHLQEAYDEGMPVNVITFHPMEGLARDRIVETIRPSVFWHDRLLQSAEVVVGTPVKVSLSTAKP